MHPVLYSFRRCPFAIRARLALHSSGLFVELREVNLQNKPAELIQCSPKGTVPVLQTPNGETIEESREIMHWALSINDPDKWLAHNNTKKSQDSTSLIDENDGYFKYYLDRYKYTERYSQHVSLYFRQFCLQFLDKLEYRLTQHRYLSSDSISITDMAIVPFIRQFAFVDKLWFEQSHFIQLNIWLERIISSRIFTECMKKYPIWEKMDKASIFPANESMHHTLLNR